MPADKWKKERPTMIMISAESWSEIRKAWLKACRFAGDACNVAVDSVDKIFQELDKILKTVVKKP